MPPSPGQEVPPIWNGVPDREMGYQIGDKNQITRWSTIQWMGYQIRDGVPDRGWHQTGIGYHIGGLGTLLRWRADGDGNKIGVWDKYYNFKD